MTFNAQAMRSESQDHLRTSVLCIWKDVAQEQGRGYALSYDGDCAFGLFNDKALVIRAGLEQQLMQQTCSGLAYPSLVKIGLNVVLECAHNVCHAHDCRLQPRKTTITPMDTFKLNFVDEGLQQDRIAVDILL